MLRDESSRLAYDKQLKYARQLLDVPIWETLESEDLNEDEEGLLCHACRCGSFYRVSLVDLQTQDKIILPCDTCSLYIEVLNRSANTNHHL